jgi:hypothetical protein
MSPRATSLNPPEDPLEAPEGRVAEDGTASPCHNGRLTLTGRKFLKRNLPVDTWNRQAR